MYQPLDLFLDKTGPRNRTRAQGCRLQTDILSGITGEQVNRQRIGGHRRGCGTLPLRVGNTLRRPQQLRYLLQCQRGISIGPDGPPVQQGLFQRYIAIQSRLRQYYSNCTRINYVLLSSVTRPSGATASTQAGIDSNNRTINGEINLRLTRNCITNYPLPVIFFIPSTYGGCLRITNTGKSGPTAFLIPSTPFDETSTT